MFTAPVVHALANFFKKQAEKLPLSVGLHPISETLNITLAGSVKRGADTTFQPTVCIPLKLAMAVLIERMGFQRDKAKEVLVEAMTEALAFSDLEETMLEDVTGLTPAQLALATRLKDVSAAMQHVTDVTGALPKQPRKGATTVSLSVTEVPEPEPQAA